MKNIKFLNNKKGVSLMECVVALLLFSIITGTVLTVFSISRKQIRKQNEDHRLDILSSNVLSVYEASKDFGDFKNMMKNNLGININGDSVQTVTTPVGSGSGAGSVPVAMSYEKIVVEKNKVDFRDAGGHSVISFNGEYENDKLTEGENGDIPSGKYNKKSVSTMVICGGIKTKLGIGLNPHHYKCTFTKNEITGKKSIEFKLDKKINSLNKIDFNKVDDWASFTVDTLSDFEEYLLDNGYYLMWDDVKTRENKNEPTRYRKWKYIKYDYSDTPKSGYDACEWKTYNDYYFQVYNATVTGSDKATPLTNDIGQNLYYCISVPSDKDGSFIQCQTQIDDAADGGGNPEKMMFALSNAKITFAYAKSRPDYSGFTNVLKNGNGKEFSGGWHFLPWVFYRAYDNSSLHIKSAKETVFSYSYSIKNEYYPTNDYKDIYYALKNGNKVELINKNGDRMFSFDATGKTNPLDDQDNCKFKDIEITKKYKGADWNLFYKKGSMPQKQITRISFDTNNKIAILYAVNESGGESPFIRFIYKSDASKAKFEQDMASVTSGIYNGFYLGNTGVVNDAYKGDIYFSCDQFDGSYSITTKAEDNDPIFVSNADNFEIIGSVESNDASWGVIGQPYSGTAPSETYFITCGLDGIDRKLLIKVTFTDLAKVKIGKTDDNIEVAIEPRIYIWVTDNSNITSDDFESLQNLSNTSKVKLQHTYRKG